MSLANAEPRPSRRWRSCARYIGFFLAYAGAAELGHWLSIASSATIWPPSGLYLALLLLSAARHWPALALTALAGNLGSDVLHGQPVPVSLAFAAANALEAFTGAWLLRCGYGAPFRLDRLNAVLGLVAVSALISTALGAAVSAAAATAAFGHPFWPAWKTEWTANVVGILLFAPLVLTCRLQPRAALQWLARIHPLVEGAALLAGLGAVAFILFLDNYTLLSLPFMVLPFLLWAALRFGLGGVALALNGLAFVAVWATMQGHGPFARLELAPAQAAVLVQLFLSICALCFLTLAALMEERRRSFALVQATNDELEQRMQERTQALQRAAEQRRLAMEAAALGAWDYDLITGAVIWDPRMRELFGVGADEPLSIERIIDWVHPDDRLQVQAAIQRALDPQADGRYDREHRIVLPDGGVRWLTVNGRTLFQGSGRRRRAVRMLGVARDVSARVQTGQSLQESAQRLSEAHALLDAIFATAPIGLGFWDRELRFVRVNERLAEINGLPVEAHIGKTPAELLPGIAHIDQLMADWRRVLATGEPLQDVEISGETPAMPGKTRYWRENCFPVRMGGAIAGLGAVVEEITEYKAAEQALRESETRFRQMADTAPAMLWITDPDGRCTFLSKSWYEFTGQTEATGLGAGWLDAVHPDYRQLVEELLLYANRRREAFEIDYRLRCSDGQYHWAVGTGRPRFAATGEFLGYVGSVIDITARKQAEEALRESEQRFRLAAHAVVGMIYDWNVPTGHVYYSEGLLQLVGVPAQKAAPTRAWWLERIHPDDRARVQAAFASVLTSQAHRCELEYRVRHADGRWIDVWDNSYFLRTASGFLLRMVGNATDITARVEVERALHEARAAADAANQAKSEFLANMSHEIRTPMAAILGYADILAAHVANPDDLKAVQTIQRNGRHLLEVINDILDLSKIESGRLELTRERFAPDSLIADVRSLMAVRAQEKGLTLAVEFEGLLPETIESDPRRLKQILINLLGNAIKFTRRGGATLRVRLREDGPAPWLEFAVIDTGIGILPTQLQQLFQPFTQLDSSAAREHGGSGLGLVISQRLTRLLGGDITVESEWGRGSTFTFTIAIGSLANVARVKPGTEPKALPALPPPAVRLAGRVLVVDDHADIRYLARRYLEEAGAEVETAADGVAALTAVAAAEARGQSFAALVLDMQMPGLDGYTVARRLRTQGFQQPIVALTAHTMKGDREKCLAAGCDEYLGKPLERDELLQLMHRLIQPVGAVPADPPAVPARCRVLIVDDNNDAADALALMLQLLGYETAAAYDGATALATARQQRPDVVILDINLPDLDGYTIVRRLKAEAQFQHSVFIALSGEDGADAPAPATGFDHRVLKPANAQELVALFPPHCAPSTAVT